MHGSVSPCVCVPMSFIASTSAAVHSLTYFRSRDRAPCSSRDTPYVIIILPVHTAELDYRAVLTGRLPPPRDTPRGYYHRGYSAPPP